jgi:hypothetical protein
LFFFSGHILNMPPPATKKPTIGMLANDGSALTFLRWRQREVVRRRGTDGLLAQAAPEAVPPVTSWSGLRNLGVTCYRNAVLQALAATLEADLPLPPTLTTAASPVLSVLPVVSELLEYLQRPSAGTGTGDALALALALATNLETAMGDDRRFADFTCNRQEDAGEFLGALLQSWLALAERFLISDTETRRQGHPKEVRSVQESPTYILYLPPGESVKLAVAAYQATESLALSEEACAKPCTTTHVLSGSPRALAVYLKRTQRTPNGTISRDATPVLLNGELAVADSLYRLVAVVDHDGGISAQNGHYTARTLRRDGHWYQFNDTVVGQTPSPADQPSGTALLLLYVAVPTTAVDATVRRGASRQTGVLGPQLRAHSLIRRR